MWLCAQEELEQSGNIPAMEHAQEVMANAVSHLVRVKGQVALLQNGATPTQQLSEEVGCLMYGFKPSACVLHPQNVLLI